MVEAVLRGFKRGEEEFGVVVRVLLCCIRFLLVAKQTTLASTKFFCWKCIMLRGLPQFSEDVLRLCVKYKDQGVVGMDIAGAPRKPCQMPPRSLNVFAGDEEGLDPKDADMFEPSTYKVLILILNKSEAK